MSYNTHMNIEITKDESKIIMVIKFSGDDINIGDLHEVPYPNSRLDEQIKAWNAAMNMCVAQLHENPYARRVGFDTWHWPVNKLDEVEAFATYLQLKGPV